MQYHVLRNVLVRNATIVMFTESKPDDSPERLIVFHSEGGGDGVSLDSDVELHYETVLAGEVDSFAECAFPSNRWPTNQNVSVSPYSFGNHK